MHERLQEPQQKATCNECKKGSYQQFQIIKTNVARILKCSQHLKRHQLAHIGNIPFECESCPQEFTCKHHLKRHIQLMISYQCQECEQKFTKKKKRLKKHQEDHHQKQQKRVNKMLKLQQSIFKIEIFEETQFDKTQSYKSIWYLKMQSKQTLKQTYIKES